MVDGCYVVPIFAILLYITVFSGQFFISLPLQDVESHLGLSFLEVNPGLFFLLWSDGIQPASMLYDGILS